MIARACLGCNDIIEAGTLCRDCRPRRPPGPSATKRGYDYRWQKLSEQARKIQPWCSDCGATTNLSVDHTPESWKRLKEGKRLTLNDFSKGLLIVRCMRCNIAAGNSRGANVNRPATL